MVFAKVDTSSGVQDTLHRIDVNYTQVRSNAKTYALDEQDYYNNYYLGHIPKGITEIFSNKRLITANLYTKVDVEYSSNQNGFKYYFVIKPGGDPTAIKMEYTGASSFNLDGTTNALTINSSVGSITYGRPVVYQVNSSNVIVPITGWTADWQTNGASNKYKFNIGAYDNTKALIIMVSGISNPAAPAGSTANLCWSTYVGGGSEDYVKGVDVDASGSQFVVGQTFSLNFPTTTGSFQTNLNGGYDAFLLKFRTTHFLQWGTYLGGSSNDNGSDVKVRKAGNGNPYIVGTTPSSDFPIIQKAGASNDTLLGGAQDGFIAEFANSNGAVKWITYFGGTGSENINSLDFDTSNRLFIAGKTNSTSGFPSVVPSGAYTQAYAGGDDAFITRFTPSDVIDWSTRYGGSASDFASSVKIDKYNNAFIIGETFSSNLPTTNPAGSGDFYDNTLNGLNDAFIVKFSYGAAVQWATYIGGDSLEAVGRNSIDFNSSNNIYIGGNTRSSNFPMKNSLAFYDNSFTGADGFLMRFDGVTYDTLLSTYISGNSYPTNINVSAIAINGDDEVFVAGITADANFPVYQQGGFYYQDTISGAPSVPDAFLMAFDQWDNEILGTYFGGYELGQQEQINDMVIDNDFLYAVGQTASIDTNGIRRFPLFDPGLTAYYDSTYNGGIYDGFVSLFCIGAVTGIHESNAPSNNGSFFVYPNPATEELNIKLNKALEKDATIELYSIEGKLVYSYVLLKHNESINIDVSQLSTGLYLLRIRNTEFNSTIKFSKN